jgi:hypothetical protein
MNRRRFFTTLGVGATALSWLPRASSQRVVWGQTFYLDKPLVMDQDNVRYINCKFIATRPMRHTVHVTGNNIDLIACYADCGIRTV